MGSERRGRTIRDIFHPNPAVKLEYLPSTSQVVDSMLAMAMESRYVFMELSDIEGCRSNDGFLEMNQLSHPLAM